MKHLLITTIAAVLLVGCGSQSIHLAARDGNIEAVKQHLDAGADVNAKDEDGSTPLHLAAREGHKEIVELLIAAGADVSAKDKWYMTPLFYAAYKGHKEVVELLIEKGATVNALGAHGTPLDWAIKHKRTEIADFLRKHGGKTGEELKGGEPVAEATQSEPPTAEAPDISIHDAAKEGNIEAVKQRLAAGTDVNVKDDGGTCSLHFASVYGHKEIVELLIASGADVNAQSGVGTPLHLAAGFDLNDMATLLIAKGADVNSIDVDGKTPADRAVSEDKKETADLLRKHGGKTGEELKAEAK
jgi:ankyrin repeat protein